MSNIKLHTGTHYNTEMTSHEYNYIAHTVRNGEMKRHGYGVQVSESIYIRT